MPDSRHYGEVVAIDIDSQCWAIGDTVNAARNRLRAERPDAVNVLFERVRYRAIDRCTRLDLVLPSMYVPFSRARRPPPGYPAPLLRLSPDPPSGGAGSTLTPRPLPAVPLFAMR